MIAGNGLFTTNLIALISIEKKAKNMAGGWTFVVAEILSYYSQTRLLSSSTSTWRLSWQKSASLYNFVRSSWKEISVFSPYSCCYNRWEHKLLWLLQDETYHAQWLEGCVHHPKLSEEIISTIIVLLPRWDILLSMYTKRLCTCWCLTKKWYENDPWSLDENYWSFLPSNDDVLDVWLSIPYVFDILKCSAIFA